MYCPQCGYQVGNEVKFCPECGKPVASLPPAPVKYDYCEIVYENRVGFNLLQQTRFWAKGIGAKGTYTAAVCDRWVNGVPWEVPLIDAFKFRQKQQEAVDQLIQKLLADRWEVMPEKGKGGWWSYQFRRVVS